MIRYYCKACQKSLKADESIIGRKAQCTRCGQIAAVPAASTRASRGKRSSTTDLNPLAISDSDAEFDFNYDDLSIDVARESQHDPSSFGSFKFSESSKSLVPPDSVDEESAPEPIDVKDNFRQVFHVVERKRTKLSPQILAFVAGMMLLVGVTYLLVGSSRFVRRTVPVKTRFEQTKEAIEYKTALFELKKNQRVMITMGNGFLTAKGLPESELGDLHEFAASLDKVIGDDFAISEANSLFDGDKPADAKQMIKVETRKLNDLRTEVLRRTKEFHDKTYN